MSTHDNSAAEVPAKLWRSASKAANNMVVSSDTKKVALHAIQNAGHGDFTAGVADAFGVGDVTVAFVMSARLRP